MSSVIYDDCFFETKPIELYKKVFVSLRYDTKNTNHIFIFK